VYPIRVHVCIVLVVCRFTLLFKDRSHTSPPSIAFSSISVFKSKGNPIPSFYTTSNQERLDSRSWAILIRIPRIDLDVDLDRWKALADSENLRNGKIHKNERGNADYQFSRERFQC